MSAPAFTTKPPIAIGMRVRVFPGSRHERIGVIERIGEGDALFIRINASWLHVEPRRRIEVVQ